MTPEEIIQLEADNQRLRDFLSSEAKLLHRNDCDGDCTWELPGMSEIVATHNAQIDKALAQPAPTTGLLDVVRAAVIQQQKAKEYLEETSWNRYKEREDAYFKACRGTNEAVQALPPETLKMLEVGRE